LPALLVGYEQVNGLIPQEKEAFWPVLLAVQLIASDFASRGQAQTLAEVNLEAFYWLYEQKEAIVQRIAQTMG
jgi:Ser/Thr protein kinase RdoA (MazF antagonist)